MGFDSAVRVGLATRAFYPAKPQAPKHSLHTLGLCGARSLLLPSVGLIPALFPPLDNLDG